MGVVYVLLKTSRLYVCEHLTLDEKLNLRFCRTSIKNKSSRKFLRIRIRKRRRSAREKKRRFNFFFSIVTDGHNIATFRIFSEI